MLLVIAINIIVFVRVMRAIFSQKAAGKRKVPNQTELMQHVVELKKGARATLSFFAILGITWIFGALSVGQGSLVFIYLFAIFNGFQGVLLFIFHCYLDSK